MRGKQSVRKGVHWRERKRYRKQRRKGLLIGLLASSAAAW